MLLNLTFTLLSNTQDEQQLIIETISLNQLIEKRLKEKGLMITKAVAGVHKNAARLHTHSGIQIQYEAKDEVKFWNKKLISLIGYKSEQYDLKISVWHENDPGFNLEPLLGYPLKEMENLENWPFLEISKGVCMPEIEEKRQWAHEQYNKAKKEQERNEERKKTADSADEKLFEYLRENIKPRNIAKKNVQRIETLPFNHKLLITKELIYDYYSERYEQTGQTSFKVLSVIDKAVAFLLFNKLVTSNELAQFR